MNFIYLDNNSTTNIDPDVARQVNECMLAGYLNPASQHLAGQRSRRRLESLRCDILRLIGATYQGMQSDQLFFTSGGTESNNLAICGLAYDTYGKLPDNNRIIVSSIEHPSVLAIADYLSTVGFDVARVICHKSGLVDLQHLETLLQTPTRLASIMTVNHETGAIQPIKEVVKLCRKYGSLIHTDAVQAVGKIPVSFGNLGVDALSFTAHKLHGPKGIGALVLKHSLSLFPRLFGGFQQQGMRPGTEDVCLPTGLLASLENFTNDQVGRAERVLILRDELERSLNENCDIVIHADQSHRVPHTSNVSFRGINRQEFLLACDLNGIGISTGSACASGSSEPSPVLGAMGLDKEVIESSVRISLSAFTSRPEVDLACERIINIYNNLRRLKSL